MGAELSIPFFLHGFEDFSADIGDGVRLERVNPDWIESVREQCPDVNARESLDLNGIYTHRFYIEIDPTTSSPFDITEDEIQPLFRAVCLSHIVKPTAIAIENVKIKTIYEQDGTVSHFCMVAAANMNIAFTSPDESWNTITEQDCRRMAAFWPSFCELLADSNLARPKYSRIVNAIKNFEYAHYIYFTNLSYLAYHAALEFLIYFGTTRENKKQITLRLPQILKGIVTQQEAEEIYSLNNHFKHGPDPSGKFTLGSNQQDVIRLTALLRRCIRELLLRALANRSFADILVDYDLMRKHYGVQVGKKII